MKDRNNINIEFARIICAILVISTHVLNRFYLRKSGDLRNSVLILSTVCITAVPVFCMITGYFTRKGQTWFAKLKKSLVSIWIPTLIFIFICVALYDVNIKKTVKALLAWKISTLPGCSHLWYITAYSRIMLLFPLLALLCCDEKPAKAARHSLILLYSIAVLRSDLGQIFDTSPFYTFNILDSCQLFFLLGYEFNDIDWKKIPKWVWYVLTAAGCVLMVVMTKWMFHVNGQFKDYFYHYETIPCLIASFGIFGLYLSLPLQNCSEKTGKTIRFLAGQTWCVYLIHLLFRDLLMEKIPFLAKSGLRPIAGLIVLTALLSFLAAMVITQAHKLVFGRLRKKKELRAAG